MPEAKELAQERQKEPSRLVGEQLTMRDLRFRFANLLLNNRANFVAQATAQEVAREGLPLLRFPVVGDVRKAMESILNPLAGRPADRRFDLRLHPFMHRDIRSAVATVYPADPEKRGKVTQESILVTENLTVQGAEEAIKLFFDEGQIVAVGFTSYKGMKARTEQSGTVVAVRGFPDATPYQVIERLGQESALSFGDADKQMRDIFLKPIPFTFDDEGHIVEGQSRAAMLVYNDTAY